MTEEEWEKEFEAGMAAKNFLKNRIEGRRIFLHSKMTDRYGKFIALVWDRDVEAFTWHTSLNKEMVDKEIVRPYVSRYYAKEEENVDVPPSYHQHT